MKHVNKETNELLKFSWAVVFGLKRFQKKERLSIWLAIKIIEFSQQKMYDGTKVGKNLMLVYKQMKQLVM